ncbi:MAG: TatD family deoxyribonuclease [Ruminococcaceae bacterium]|nr:TatD family deoxyribonuclease [Oscillospiraceae bacterium]
MYSNIFDTHAHYDDSRFDEDRNALISSLKSKGISHIINCGCDLKSCITTVSLAESFDFIYAAVGIHAHEADEATESDLQKIKKLYSNKKVVAVGEIGLDYHYNFSPRERQIEIFECQLMLSKELDLPVIIHDREAHEDTMNLLKKYRPKGVVHCFSGSAEMAKEIVKLGMYIGIGGAVTFKNAKKPVEVVEYLPVDRLLLETDAPYMTPVPFRGQRCDSSHIAYTAEKIAEIKGIDVQELINICNENAKQLFTIK